MAVKWVPEKGMQEDWTKVHVLIIWHIHVLKGKKKTMEAGVLEERIDGFIKHLSLMKQGMRQDEEEEVTHPQKKGKDFAKEMGAQVRKMLGTSGGVKLFTERGALNTYM